MMCYGNYGARYAFQFQQAPMNFFYSTVFFITKRKSKILNIVYSECFVRGPKCLYCLDSVQFWKKKETVTL